MKDEVKAELLSLHPSSFRLPCTPSLTVGLLPHISVHGAVLHGGFGAQSEARLRLARSRRRHVCDVLADNGAVLEAVAGAAADEPDVFKRRVAVNQEVAVRSVLVLADARLDDGRGAERGQTACEVSAHSRESFTGDDALALVRVEGRAVSVNRQLDAALFQIRGA